MSSGSLYVPAGVDTFKIDLESHLCLPVIQNLKLLPVKRLNENLISKVNQYYRLLILKSHVL